MNPSLVFSTVAHQKALSAEQTADVAQSMVHRHRDEVDALERQVEHLTLVCQAMWEVIRDQTGFTEEQLEQKVVEIDVRDDRLDGKIRPKICTCPSCGRNNNTRRRNCVICGAFLERDHIFEN